MISCPSASACGTSSYVSNCCSFVTSFSWASCRIDLGTHPKSLDHIVSGSGSCKSSATAFNSVYVSKLPSDSSIIANVSGFTEAEVQEFLHVSPAVLTPLPASTDASACSRFASSWAPPRSALQGLTSWSRYASSASLQRLASPCLLPYRSPSRRVGVEAARPQVQVVLLPLVQSQKVSLNLKVLLNLQVFSRRQPRRHAVLPNVPWSTRTLVSWLYTPSYDGTLDEPRCTPCSLASKSTSHHELSALPEMVLNLKDFAANQ